MNIKLLLIVAVFSAAIFSANCAEIILQDAAFRVAFDSETGALTRFENKTTGWVMQRRAELGVSFRMHVPTDTRRHDFILGYNMKADKVEKISDSEVRMQWSNMQISDELSGPVLERTALKPPQGYLLLPITFSATVTLKDGRLTFAATVENRSDRVIESIDYPYFGDFNPPAKNDRLNVRTMWYGNLQSDEIYPRFNNGKGYWGVFYPTKTFDSFRSLFCLIQAKEQGLYVEMHDPTQPYLIEYTFEQHPGVLRGDDPVVPQEDKISGMDVHLDFRTCHFVFVKSNTKKQLVPILIRSYKGDWHQAVDYYKEWRAKWFRPAHLPAWIKDVHSWIQLQINSSENNLMAPYSELVNYANECADNGVKAMQLVGYQLGGQDRGDPSLDFDPGLGNYEELKNAIADCEQLGVRMILFGGKPNFADKSTEWYKNELYKYACIDPYGIAYEHGSYSYYTPTQLSGINNRRRAVMDFLSPQYQDIMAKELRKLLGFNASGWLFDENCHHGGIKYNFATDHGYEAPGFIYGGDLLMGAKLRAEADKINPDFIFAGEGHQDWQMQYYPVSYFRINNGSTAVDRYVDPYAPLVVAVTGIDDREKLNLILMGRYIISYEPFNFKGHITDFPLTLEYGKKIDAMRRKYREYLWDAEYRDTQGATVKADGNYRYSVFRTKSGKRAVVAVNTGADKAISVQVSIPNARRLVTATPENPDAQDITGAVSIPPRSAVVIMEK
ncbi:MAG: DUF6259 domain-containing protein [Tannerella sp.]|nr:DUF6259 domain-containing protein [Tannerella sp.]